MPCSFLYPRLVLVGLLWWRMAGYLDRKTAAVIRADIQAISDSLRVEGLPGAVEMIDERLGQADGSAAYLLADAALKPIAGNLPRWPSDVEAKPGWYKASLLLNNRLRPMRIEE